MQLYGIIGHPLEHSLSPALHNWAFAKRCIHAAFAPWPIAPEQLADFVSSMRLLKFQGACVTIPHKERILPLLDSISPHAQKIGAVNTLYWQDGQLCGDNTDVYGFMFPLQAHSLSNALVLGAGGAARAVLMGLQLLGLDKSQIFLCNHNNEKAQSMAEEFGVTFYPWDARTQLSAKLIINTTPLGMQGKHVHQSPYPAKAFRSDTTCLAYDLVYNPLHTQFLLDAKAAGWQIQDGLDMFVGQALKQMQIWTGGMTEFQETRQYLQDLLK